MNISYLTLLLLFYLDESTALWESWIVVLRGLKKYKTVEIFCLFAITCSVIGNKILLLKGIRVY